MRSVIIVENESLLLSLQHDSEQRRTAYAAVLNCALYGALQSQYFSLPPPHVHIPSPYMMGQQGHFFFPMGVVSAAQSHLAGQAVTELGMDAAQLAVYYKHTRTHTRRHRDRQTHVTPVLDSMPGFRQSAPAEQEHLLLT